MGLQLVWTKHLWLSWCENLGAEAWYLHQAFEGLQSYVLFSSAGILRATPWKWGLEMFGRLAKSNLEKIVNRHVNKTCFHKQSKPILIIMLDHVLVDCHILSCRSWIIISVKTCQAKSQQMWETNGNVGCEVIQSNQMFQDVPKISFQQVYPLVI